MIRRQQGVSPRWFFVTKAGAFDEFWTFSLESNGIDKMIHIKIGSFVEILYLCAVQIIK